MVNIEKDMNKNISFNSIYNINYNSIFSNSLKKVLLG